MSQLQKPRIVIIGAGFGGLYAAKRLAKKNVDVLLIDRQNYHTFTPLLYQVATCGLEFSEIAYPIRGIFYDKPNITFMMGNVVDINYTARNITVATEEEVFEERYDYLIISAGSVTNFFGNDAVAENAFGLKDLYEAVDLRNHILRLFEQAAHSDDPQERAALTTMVVVGGGPTGLETAGALHELYNYVLKKEYRQSDGVRAKVILTEATDRLLIPYPSNLQQAAKRQLESLGVDVRVNAPVKEFDGKRVVLQDGTVIPCHTLVWAAGVKASPMAEMLQVPLQRQGRVPVEPTMRVDGRENIYVVGDMAYLEDDSGRPYPMLIPVAKQQGILAADNILNHINGKQEASFVYRDRGMMATIGRSRAVAYIFNRIPLTGYFAWAAWMVLHLLWLVGFRNRLNVFINWTWNYITYDRSVRIILHPVEPERVIEQPEHIRELAS
jgi:NADH dehydrogenase